MIKHTFLPTLVAVFLAVLAGIDRPAAAEDAATVPPAEAAPLPIPETLLTPRATMATFLDAMTAVREGDAAAIDDAIATLDLAEVNPLVRSEKGRELVWTLQEVLDRTRVPLLRKIPSRKEGRPYVFQNYDDGQVAIEFVPDQGWLFSRETVAALPLIMDALAGADKVKGAAAVDSSQLPLNLRIRAAIPAKWKREFIVLEQWQWVGILLIVVAGSVLDRIIAVFLGGFVHLWRRRFAQGAYRDIPDGILRPLALMVMAFVWWAGLNLLGLPAQALVILLVSVKFLACFASVWTAYRLVDLVAAYLRDRALATSSKLDDALVPLVTKTIKLFVTVMGVVFIADNLEVDVTSLLAGLGLGGLAFALAAKDVAGNLFGSITVLLDQPFHVGDWVKVGDVEGTVEAVGFRSTRIRTFYNSLVSVPNSNLITSSVDNLGKRRYRRLSCKFGIAYDTPPDRIEAFCAGIREIVALHPYMRKDNFHVYFNEFGDSALKILVYVFWETPDWATELRERHRFLLDCLRLAERLGVEFAFPTHTVYMKQGGDTPLSPPAGDFAPEVDQGSAFDIGRAEARAIVAATTGLDVVPPPAGVNVRGADDDGG